MSRRAASACAAVLPERNAMFRSKNTVRIIALAAVAVILTLLLASCKDDSEPKKKLLGIQAEFKGDSVDSADYVYTKDDFTVTASYNDYSDVETDDYEFEILGFTEGFCVIYFTKEDESCYCYVKVNMDVYPSDTEDSD